MSTKNIKNAKNFDELLDIKYGKLGVKKEITTANNKALVLLK